MKKVRSKKAFTLTELLVTLLIATLAIATVSTAIPAAIRVYRESLFESESEVLISTINTELENILGYSTEINTQNNKVYFTNLDTYTAGPKTYYKYGINNGYLFISTSSDDTKGHIMYNTGSENKVLSSNGIYRGKTISDFTMTYDETNSRYVISYTVNGAKNSKDSGLIYIQAFKEKYN